MTFKQFHEYFDHRESGVFNSVLTDQYAADVLLRES